MMKKKRTEQRPGPWAAFGLLCLVSVGAACLPLSFRGLEGDAAALLAAVYPWLAVLPIALLGPFLAAKNGVPPIAAFFPPGLCFLLDPFYPGKASFACVLLLLSLAAACAGQEWERRRRGSGRKGPGHPPERTGRKH